MKNIQIIDGAENCVYDVFQVTDEEFSVIFPNDEDIAFIDEVEDRIPFSIIRPIFGRMWTRRIAKKNANGIHGIIFFELENKKIYYPTRRDEEAINPGGSRLR